MTDFILARDISVISPRNIVSASEKKPPPNYSPRAKSPPESSQNEQVKEGYVPQNAPDYKYFPNSSYPKQEPRYVKPEINPTPRHVPPPEIKKYKYAVIVTDKQGNLNSALSHQIAFWFGHQATSAFSEENARQLAEYVILISQTTENITSDAEKKSCLAYFETKNNQRADQTSGKNFSAQSYGQRVHFRAGGRNRD